VRHALLVLAHLSVCVNGPLDSWLVWQNSRPFGIYCQLNVIAYHVFFRHRSHAADEDVCNHVERPNCNITHNSYCIRVHNTGRSYILHQTNRSPIVRVTENFLYCFFCVPPLVKYRIVLRLRPSVDLVRPVCLLVIFKQYLKRTNLLRL